MATATASKKRKTTNKINLKKTLSDINNRLVVTSEDVIDNTVLTGEKYQKLFAKTIKKTEPIIEKQVDMVFGTIESLRDQYAMGADRFKKLIEWKDIKKSTTKTVKSLRKNVEEKVEAIQSDLNLGGKSVNTPSKAKKSSATKVTATRTSVAKATNTKTSAPKVTARKASTQKISRIVDLKLIDGIGPKMERILHAGGIKSVDALAKATVAQLEKVVSNSGSTFRAISPESWVKQAKQIIK